jgi:hypothetical protein
MKLEFAVSASILLAILFIATVGAFLLYVPALAVFTVATILVGLGLMFALGLATGSRWRRSSRFTHSAMPTGRPPGDLSVVR